MEFKEFFIYLFNKRDAKLNTFLNCVLQLGALLRFLESKINKRLLNRLRSPLFHYKKIVARFRKISEKSLVYSKPENQSTINLC